MARLVARALRLGRSALIQTGTCAGYVRHYRLSYLISILMWQGPAILVAPTDVQQRLLLVEIPQLQQWMDSAKTILRGDRWPDPNFRGLLLMTPEDWLRDRLSGTHQIPSGIPTILDNIDDLERWTSHCLTVNLHPQDWHELALAYPYYTDLIRDSRVQLTRLIFQRPNNPYGCYVIDQPERDILQQLYDGLTEHNQSALALPTQWRLFEPPLRSPNTISWATVDREMGQFSLYTAPVDLSAPLSTIWPAQPVVLIGGTLDLDADAAISRQRLGLTDVTCVQFSPDRQTNLIHLYLPEKLPMPNTPQYQAALMQEICGLLNYRPANHGLTVVLVGDTPLKTQVAALLAAEFGSRVQVEKVEIASNGILVTGWEFWQQHQDHLPAPNLLAIATLPIPSLENPLVAGRVAHYKQLRQDWFRLYLLPEALNTLQRAIAPLRPQQGVVALLDSRVVHRSYGQHVLSALSPLARINYSDINLCNLAEC